MGRSAVRGDRKRKPRAFALAEQELALIALYAEQNDLSRSQAMRALLKVAEEQMDSTFRRDLAIRRQSMGEAARAEAAAAPATERTLDKCPSCGNAEMFIAFPNGAWRCDLCLATGTAA